MEQKITLEFSKDIIKLAGNEFGNETYKEQAMGKANFELPVTIVFHERIVKVATSFIQGFFEDIVKQIGITGVARNIEFETSIPNFKQFVLNNLE